MIKRRTINNKRTYIERTNKDEFLGFGKKKKADTKLDWKDASKIVKSALDKAAKRHSDIDWANHGKAEISSLGRGWVTLKSMTGADIQYLQTNRVVVSTPDLDDKTFDCYIEDGEVNGLGKVMDYFVKVDQKQGNINAQKNKKLRRECVNNNSNNNNNNKNDIKESTKQDEKLSDKKIKKMKDDFGTFVWWDMVTPGWGDFTVYATGHSLIVSKDKELRAEVEKVDPNQKEQWRFEKNIISLIESCDSGSDKGGWENIGLTIESIKNGEKEKGRFGGRLLFDYNGNKVALLNNNFTDFLRMFSGSVTGKTPVLYNREMDAIGLKYKDEYGLLMTMG